MKDQTPVFTLKVYTNRVQVAALVLDHDQQPLPQIDFRRFEVSLDGGKKFAPTLVRMEGEDPIDLAILLDVSGTQRHLITSVEEAAATMVAKSLRPQDRISIYALNCNLIRTADGRIPTPDLVRRSIETALTAPHLNKSDDPTVHCGKNVYLLGALGSVVKELGDSNGRRVVLAISDGRDDGGVVTWKSLHEFAVMKGVAIFGMNDSGSSEYNPWLRDRVDPFETLCESTGGIVLHVSSKDLQKKLEQWVALIRGRYVVEFPRPQQLPNGENGMSIFIKKDPMAFVTFAGVSLPLPDPTITSDPNYVPSREGSDIPVGARRPLPQ